LTVAEWAVILPFLAFITAIVAGVDGDTVRLPFLISEAAGILLYMSEIRYRFRHGHRHGRRP
jgi:hypothetical protein